MISYVLRPVAAVQKGATKLTTLLSDWTVECSHWKAAKRWVTYQGVLCFSTGHECGAEVLGPSGKEAQGFTDSCLRKVLRLRWHRSDLLCLVLPKEDLIAVGRAARLSEGWWRVWSLGFPTESEFSGTKWALKLWNGLYIYIERERVCICTYTYMKAIFHGFGVCFFLTISLQTEFWGFQGTWGVMKETATEYIRENFLNVRSMKMHYSLQTRTLHCLQC